MALVVGTVELAAVPAVREVDVQLQRRLRRTGGDVAGGVGGEAVARPVQRRLHEPAVPVGDAERLRRDGVRVAGDDAQAGREGADRGGGEAAVVDDRAERQHRPAVRVEGRRPVRGGVGPRLTRPRGGAERRERREGVRRAVADEGVVVREPRLAREDDRVVGRMVAVGAGADEGGGGTGGTDTPGLRGRGDGDAADDREDSGEKAPRARPHGEAGQDPDSVVVATAGQALRDRGWRRRRRGARGDRAGRKLGSEHAFSERGRERADEGCRARETPLGGEPARRPRGRRYLAATRRGVSRRRRFRVFSSTAAATLAVPESFDGSLATGSTNA